MPVNPAEDVIQNRWMCEIASVRNRGVPAGFALDLWKIVPVDRAKGVPVKEAGKIIWLNPLFLQGKFPERM
ncbi:MAG: hypothetical protein D6681_01535, partial [Calditrichaeota bacterium]